MESEREKPWRRNAPNELIVNSILAAISTIVLQTIVTSEHPKYWIGWLVSAVISILFFVVSTEQLGESIREDNIKLYIRSLNLYNFGVLFMFLSVSAIFNRYGDLNLLWSSISCLIVALFWLGVWGRDTAFLIFRGQHYDRWRRKMDGEVIEGEILDHYDIILARIRFWRH
jgi:hypothetical protein